MKGYQTEWLGNMSYLAQEKTSITDLIIAGIIGAGLAITVYLAIPNLPL